MFTKRLHVFKAGSQTSAQGVEREFTPEDLQQVVDSYDPSTHEAPLVIGHSGDNDSTPSYGWIKNFVRKGDDLYADVDFTDTAKDLVKNGHYRKVSISFYSPNSPINPHKGHWSARHLALLGAAPPAVKGLEPFSFSEKDGVFDFVAAVAPDQIFDKELGPTLILDKGPLEILKERLEELRGDIKTSMEQLEANQDAQTETKVGPEETTPQAENTAPENPNQQFSEMKKKMGREGAEASESAQKLANLETMAPDDQYDEGITRKKAKGAHGHEVQVVEEVFEEDDMSSEHKELPPALKRNMERMKAKAKHAEMDSEEDMEAEHRELPPALKKNMERMKAKHAKMEAPDEEENEESFAEDVSDKTASGGKVKFGKHAAKRDEDTAGRGLTGRSKDDSYGDRQTVGKGDSDGRDVTSDDAGEQDERRKNTSKSAAQDEDRDQLAKAGGEDAGDAESRWADQPEAKERAMDNDQYGKGDEGFTRKAGISDGKEPHGRDGGPTEVSDTMEEEPSDEEIVVPLQSTKGNKTVRVLHQTSSDKRAPLKGGPIADHAEGEADGLTREPKKAKVSDGTDARGRDGGPTEFPTRSEEDPDDMEMAVDLEDATESPNVRIIRQKSGDMPSTDHSEDLEDIDEDELDEFIQQLYGERDPMTRTGKGSTYGQKRHHMEEYDDEEMEDDEDEYSETEDFCGMGSIGQSRAMGFPAAMYEELTALKAENNRLKREYEEHKVRTRKAKIADFIDSLYVEGKLTDGIIPQRELQSYCEGIEFGTLEFSEGESPTSRLFEMFSRLPNLVYFGEVVSNAPYTQPEEEELDPHEKALRMVANGEASDYVEAIKRCIPWSPRG